MAGGYWAENKHFHISSGVLTISSNGLYITLPSVNGFEFDTVNKRILFRFNGILAAQIRDKTLIKEILKIAEEVSD